MATIAKARAKANGTWVAPKNTKPADFVSHFIRVVLED